MEKLLLSLQLTRNKALGILLTFFGTLWLIWILYSFNPSLTVPDNAYYRIFGEAITFKHLSLFLINIGLLKIIFSKEFREDERIEIIRNYCYIYAFRSALFVLVAIGLFKYEFNLLIIIAIIQLYYFLLFRLCMHRDSAIVYANDDVKKRFAKNTNRTLVKGLRFIYILSFCIVLINFTPLPLGLLLIIIVFVLELLITVAIHWKSESLNK